MMYAKRYLLWTYTTAKPSLSNAGAQQKRWMIGVVSFLAPLLILCGENTMMSLLLYKTNIGFGLAMVVMLHHSGVHVSMRTAAWNTRANGLLVRCRQSFAVSLVPLARPSHLHLFQLLPLEVHWPLPDPQ
jgi:hypothetical protein